MGHPFVGFEIAVEVIHHLMSCDNYFALTVGCDLDGLDIRIDDCPLTLPIAAHAIASVDVAPVHSIRPKDLGILFTMPEAFLIRAGFLALRPQVAVAAECGKRVRA